MILRICAFTDAGRAVAARIADAFPDDITETRAVEPLAEWTRDSFMMHAPLVFVGACGIAVRAIAPYLRDKTLDSPVVVVDEGSRFAIPILAGHLGGANKLADAIAERLGAQAVVTTATDVRGLFAVDVFAELNALRVCDRAGIVRTSSKILAGERVTVAVDTSVRVDASTLPAELELRSFPPTEVSPVDVVVTDEPGYDAVSGLRLAPKGYVVGVGCRRGTALETLERVVGERLASVGGRWEDVAAIASVDVKRREYGLVRLAMEKRVGFVTYPASELEALEGDFAVSEFVRATVGTSNVCERAAARYAGEDAEFVARKSAEDGVTVAVMKRTPVIRRWKV